MRIRALAALPVLLALGAGALEAQDRGMAILRDAADRYGPVRSLCADFVQRLETPLLGTERTARGELCQEAPNLFAMRFTDPAGDVFVVDGEHVWYYFPSNDDKQVFQLPASRGTRGLDFHREFLENPEQKYEVTYEGEEQVGGSATHRLRLVPTTPQTYSAATLWIEQGTAILRQIQLVEENGNRRTITLDRIRFDVIPPDGWFEFTPPPGTVVITR
ncbi:MAG TPA: outer membrane lipoprotein carrier protein LolA [Longimicrobiales bacterium]|nr:outer membrane lipoprotein carrier protein LolA [Longimicrobiales bacterium]